MTNELVASNVKARLPMPSGIDEMTAGKWRVLCESIFPSAKSPEAILMAIDYCRARKLDIMKKPVHIVPMWSSSLNKQVETVWPSITEVQTTAARTGQYAGVDEPKWGNEIKRTFKGVKVNNVGESTVELSIPEWCAVTVYRMIEGQRCAFTEPVYWQEAYGRIGKTELPNDQWAKRPRGMIIKVAKAFSLRAAFPEEGEHVAEEMEGRVLEESDENGVIVDPGVPLKVGSPFKTATLRNVFFKNTTESYANAKTHEELKDIVAMSKATLDAMRASTFDADALAIDGIGVAYKVAYNRISRENEPEEEPVDNDEFRMPRDL